LAYGVGSATGRRHRRCGGEAPRLGRTTPGRRGDVHGRTSAEAVVGGIPGSITAPVAWCAGTPTQYGRPSVHGTGGTARTWEQHERCVVRHARVLLLGRPGPGGGAASCFAPRGNGRPRAARASLR
jgi:hypothetical protein